ncbi:MAG TPA: 2-oxoglutarate dehydrogenase E1 component, partial [Thermopetrobacter sp.]|nr:2-oxoglutarate dehydrogenase E1 component [Thermopetrobacter sp.]
QLIREGLFTAEEVRAMERRFRETLEMEFEAAEDYRPSSADWLSGYWKDFPPPATSTIEEPRHGRTSLSLDTLRRIGRALTTVPENFNIHPTLRRIVEARRQAIESGRGIDWATAEQLAWGGLLLEGYRVRLSGQDVRRGTFSQRHAVWIDQLTDDVYIPLNHIDPHQPARADFINSILSEEAVLGFEYGYSLVDPNVLVMWEAQFGDFANGAQVVFDQFIAAAEHKWQRLSGITCLLPHGYEGQGPEHSSARLERYLQLCAQDNMQVANCTTPANYFHILRRQMKREFRRPLILMTPKSLLRHRLCVSDLEEMGPGTHFRRTLPDDAERRPGSTVTLRPDDEIRRVIICSGKVYYDLHQEREKRGIDDVYILRLEQLYPFPHDLLASELSRFPADAEFVWCQEEPWNMGAWWFVEYHLQYVLDRIEARQMRPAYVGRPAAAAPATGLLSKHLAEQARLVDEALSSGRLVGRAWRAAGTPERRRRRNASRSRGAGGRGRK